MYVMYTMGCAAILVYVHVILFKKHTEFNFCHFFKILSSYDTWFWQYEVNGGEDSTCGPVDCSTV
jgi:hypothetical protein